jgi:hypothetical protein
MFGRLALALTCLTLTVGTADAADPRCVLSSYNPAKGIPPGYTADQGFKGRFDYPAASSEKVPDFLSNKDFRADWRGYMDAVLDYVLEGNQDGTDAGVNVAFRVQDNHKRNWYHGAWMDRGNSGREFLHGLTSERATRDNQLGDGVQGGDPTWAIGFYNEIGATTFAKVFKDPCQPDISDVMFPLGTVSFKLLFSGASDKKVPYLKGAPTWQADINRDAPDPANRVQMMHLLQIDIAVRDPRAGINGWVFGTFVYAADVASTNPWRRLKPVGLMWGDDANATANYPVKESVVNTALAGVTYGWTARPEMGWKGRLNGPLDNLISSCMSCHGTAQFPRSEMLNNFPAVAATDAAYGERLRTYFRDIAPGQVFDPVTRFFGDKTKTLVNAVGLDYSLQIQTGLERLCNAARSPEKPFDVLDVPAVCLPSSWVAKPMLATNSDRASQRRELENIDWNSLDEPIR